MEVINELTSGNALLNLLPTNKEKLVEDVKVYDNFGCCDHKTGAQDPERSDPMGNCPEGQRGLGQLANLQGQPPQSKGMVFCNV